MHVVIFGSILSSFLYGLLVNFKLFQIQFGIIMIYFIGHYLKNRQQTSIKQKILMSAWSRPQNASFYFTIELNCEIIDKFISDHNQGNPENRITYTHFFIKLLGKSLKTCPDTNGSIVFGHFYPFRNVKMTTLVAVQKKNLSGVHIENCESLSFEQIRNKTNPSIKDIKYDKFEEHNQQMKLTLPLHSSIVSLLLQFANFISYYMRVSFKLFRIRKHSFGTIVLTNISKMNFFNSHAPLVNFINAPFVIAICKPKDKVVVAENDQMIVRKMINLSVTFDQRYADAATIEPMVKKIYHLAKHPKELL